MAAERAGEAIAWLTTMHHAPTPQAERPLAATPHVDQHAIRARHRQAALAAVGRFDWSGRAQAKAHAEREAQAEIDAALAQARSVALETQRSYDWWWSRLTANDPEVVMSVLAEALLDNGAPAAPAGVDGTTVNILMSAPDPGDVTEYKPATTSTGRPTTAKLTKTERNELYASYVGSHVLATVREALAIAPGIEVVRVVVVRNDAPFGDPDFKVLLAATFARTQLTGLDWATLHPVDALRAADEVEVNFRGQAKEMAPVKLERGSDLAVLIDSLNSPEPDPGSDLAEGSAGVGSPHAPGATAPAGWNADPLGRHELRYWDGSEWTAHVSDRGVQGVDLI